jgi:hypothetical protein
LSALPLAATSGKKAESLNIHRKAVVLAPLLILLAAVGLVGLYREVTVLYIEESRTVRALVRWPKRSVQFNQNRRHREGMFIAKDRLYMGTRS